MDKYNLNLNPLITYSRNKGGSSNAQAQLAYELDKKKRIEEKYLISEEIKKDFHLFSDTFTSKQSKKPLIDFSDKAKKLIDKSNLEMPTEHEEIDSAIDKLDKIEKLLIEQKNKPLYKFIADKTVSNPVEQKKPTLSSYMTKKHSDLNYTNPFASNSKNSTALKYKKIVDDIIDKVKERLGK
jgi:hypothetical protein